ncbi:NAD(P)H-hydrate epimerase [Litoreibacter arenae]|nr:NAD(P)H-hydrate epimerase [Litoreibacter arenae]
MKTSPEPEVITSDEMRALEQAAISSGKVTGLELMERAGRGVVEAIFEEWPALAVGQHRAVVLCGPGNNGGDGFVVARVLKEAGWDVELFLFGDATALPPDAATNFERWSAMGEVADIKQALHVDFDACDLVVDALFGIGLSRPVTAPVLRDLFKAVSQADKPARVAIDVPSGLDSDTGLPPDGGSALRADLTVTFHAFKPCHQMKSLPGIVPESAALARYTVVKDIGL